MSRFDFNKFCLAEDHKVQDALVCLNGNSIVLDMWQIDSLLEEGYPVFQQWRGKLGTISPGGLNSFESPHLGGSSGRRFSFVWCFQ